MKKRYTEEQIIGFQREPELRRWSLISWDKPG